MIFIGPLWQFLVNMPFNLADDEWHRAIPLFPRVTIDGYLVWLWPVWKRFVPSTDWEGSNWYYEWRAKPPHVHLSAEVVKPGTSLAVKKDGL